MTDKAEILMMTAISKAKLVEEREKLLHTCAYRSPDWAKGTEQVAALLAYDQGRLRMIDDILNRCMIVD